MKSFLLLGVLLTTSLLASGDRGGNGGGLHSCPSVGSYQLYDMYEGYTRYDVPRPSVKKTIDGHIAHALKRIYKASPMFGVLVEKEIKYLREEGHLLLRPNIKLELINDANILVVDEGCRYEQLANWDDVSGNVLVRKERFDKLDDLSKAALYLHEALYKVDRDRFFAQNSDGIRRTVAEALSDKSAMTNLKKWDDKVSSYVTVVSPGVPSEITLEKLSENGPLTLNVHLGDANFWTSAISVEAEVSFPNAQMKIKELNLELSELSVNHEILKKKYNELNNGRNHKKLQKVNEELAQSTSNIDQLKWRVDSLSKFGKRSISFNNEWFNVAWYMNDYFYTYFKGNVSLERLDNQTVKTETDPSLYEMVIKSKVKLNGKVLDERIIESSAMGLRTSLYGIRFSQNVIK